MSTPQKGVKRPPEFHSPPSPSKKEVMVGYILDVEEIPRRFYYSVQVQTSANEVIRFTSYHVDLHPKMCTFADSSQAARLEVYRNDDGPVRFNTYCKFFLPRIMSANFTTMNT